MNTEIVREKLNSMTVKELRALATKLGCKKPRKKQDLVAECELGFVIPLCVLAGWRKTKGVELLAPKGHKLASAKERKLLVYRGKNPGFTVRIWNGKKSEDEAKNWEISPEGEFAVQDRQNPQQTSFTAMAIAFRDWSPIEKEEK